MKSNESKPSWALALLLPNLRLHDPIEAGHVALVPVGDPRVVSLRDHHENVGRFLDSFTDPFGRRISPSVVLVDENSHSYPRSIEMLASFRDLVALSVIPFCRAMRIQDIGYTTAPFSDAFRIYPWNLTTDFEHLMGHTPMLLGLDSVDTFCGQSSPELFQVSLTAAHIDKALLDSLITRWKRRYNDKSPSWSDRALFRSLNMANQAAYMPAGTDLTIYDVGRSLSLWVSAFEILAHPGSRKSGLMEVYGLLDQVDWLLDGTRYRRYAAYQPYKKKKSSSVGSRRTLASWLYGEIYKTRNNFLHGNKVSPRSLMITKSDHRLFDFAAPVYRMALTGFLSLKWDREVPCTNDLDGIAQYVADHAEFHSKQRNIEEALLRSVRKVQ